MEWREAELKTPWVLFSVLHSHLLQFQLLTLFAQLHFFAPILKPFFRLSHNFNVCISHIPKVSFRNQSALKQFSCFEWRQVSNTCQILFGVWNLSYFLFPSLSKPILFQLLCFKMFKESKDRTLNFQKNNLLLLLFYHFVSLFVKNHWNRKMLKIMWDKKIAKSLFFASNPTQWLYSKIIHYSFWIIIFFELVT